MKGILIFVAICLTFVFAQYNGPCSAETIQFDPEGSHFIYSNNLNGTSYSQCGESSSSVVWYMISSPEETTVKISTCNAGTNFDTVLYIGTGSCSTLNCLLSNDDASCIIVNEASTLQFSMVPNQAYYIGVGGFSSQTGEFTLSIDGLGLEQTCDTAVSVRGPFTPAVQIFTSNTNSSSGYQNSQCDLNNYYFPVWFNLYPASSSLPMTISTCNSSTTIDTIISVFTGSCSALQCSAYNDDACGSYRSSVTFTPSQPSYLVAVSGYAGYIGNIAVSFSQALETSCSNPTVISPGASITQSIVGQTVVSSDPCGIASGEPGFWFILQNLSSSTTATLSTCSPSTNYDTTIAVYSGSCSSLSCVASNDDTVCPITGSDFTSKVSFTPSSSTTYYAIVSGYGTATGTFVLTLSQP